MVLAGAILIHSVYAVFTPCGGLFLLFVVMSYQAAKEKRARHEEPRDGDVEFYKRCVVDRLSILVAKLLCAPFS